ncbi:tonB dependent receptor family protein [Asticcacaulis biprosthecium C19]|uniref:TonB dependent receptor family protein n=1 Tax=Asticcacaulis biprosthecium C19 TaxID=715226 RepID=F4QQD0_9CAUL|nr:TonB-dependent receptor [Asticcacaulis biprosthecium]EGF90417.1 tonB dependent receptor family protein [Asticcacaulis biprosthecium C19]
MHVSAFRPWLMAAASLVAVAAATSVQAQDAAQVSVAEEQPIEVIITTQKRSQAQFKVPVAVTALSQSFMDEVGINDFAQLSRFVPGFEVQDQSPNNPGFVIRGITSDSGDSVGETRVSVFQDGVSISRSRGSYVELFDLNRVEVAKGPQSTLFGRGALIGAVNVIQAKANPVAFDASAALSLGSLDYRQLDAMINVPLGDTAAVRVAGRSKSRDGYTENLLDGEDFNSLDTDAARISFNWQPTEAFNLDLIYNFQQDGNSGTGFKSGTFVPTDPTTGQVLGDTSPFTGAALVATDGFKGGRELGLDRTVEGTTLLMSYQLSPAYSLTSTTAVRRFNSSEVFDADGFSLGLLTAAEDAKASQASQEIRLNYDGDRLSWFAGASYFDEHGSQHVPLQIDELGYLALLNNLLNPAHPATSAQIRAGLGATSYAPFVSFLKSNHREAYTNFGDTSSADVYADLTYRFTPKFELSAGVRYTQDDKTSGYSSEVSDHSGLAALQAANAATTAWATQFYQTNGVPPTALQQQAYFQAQFGGALALPLGLTVQPTAGRIDKTFEDDGVTWRLVGRYEFNSNVSTYLSFATGRQPKTFSGSAPSLPGGTPKFTEAAAETVDSVEFGVKSRLMDGRLIWDSAIYNYDYQNFRTTVQTGPTTFEERSAGEANAYGLETQTRFRARPGFDLFATYAYSQARFGNGLYEDNSFRLNPDHKVSLGAHFVRNAHGAVWTVTPTYSWQSEIFFDDDNDLNDAKQDEVQEAYGLLNLRVGYAPDNARWKLELFIDNATDKNYLKDAGNTGDGVGIPTFIEGAPRTYGLTFRIRN